jgi:hypothetical protein
VPPAEATESPPARQQLQEYEFLDGGDSTGDGKSGGASVEMTAETPGGVGRKRWYEGCSYVCMACSRSYDIYFSYHGHIKKIHDLSMEQYHARYRCISVVAVPCQLSLYHFHARCDRTSTRLGVPP